MSIEIAKNQIKTFLGTEAAEVLVIKGQWGTGKTYTWNDALKKSREAGSIALDKYAYVSLFGISNMKDLKLSLFQNSVHKSKAGKFLDFEEIRAEANSFIEGVKSFDFKQIRQSVIGAAPLGKKNIAHLLSHQKLSFLTESLTFFSVNKQIICLDDLERKGDGLTFKDVLGIVSLLKEERGCKVVILLNEGAIDDVEYMSFKEKVVDKEVSFVPTAKECCDIAFGDHNSDFVKNASEFAQRLDIRNLRVLFKIRSLLEDVDNIDVEYNKLLEKHLLHTTVLLCWSYYCSQHDKKSIPPISFIKKTAASDWYLKHYKKVKAHKSGNEEHDSVCLEEVWYSILKSYEFTNLDDLDASLLQGVESGYFDIDDLTLQIKQKNLDYERQQKRQNYHESWRLLDGSFDDNADLVIASIFKKTYEALPLMVPGDLQDTISLLRAFGKDKDVTELIDSFIEANKNKPDVLVAPEVNRWGKRLDEELYRKCAINHKQYAPQNDIEAVLKRIVSQNGWAPDDILTLSGAKVDDFYNLFKKLRDKDLNAIIGECLRFGTYAGQDKEKYELIHEKTRHALIRIAKENHINKYRVKVHHGIDIDEL